MHIFQIREIFAKQNIILLQKEDIVLKIYKQRKKDPMCTYHEKDENILSNDTAILF